MNDWYVQRISALVLLSYFLFIAIFIFYNGEVGFTDWNQLFSTLWMKIYTLLAVISLLLHSWVGIWTVLTDYVHNSLIRGLIQTLAILGYLVCLVWTITILWA